MQPTAVHETTGATGPVSQGNLPCGTLVIGIGNNLLGDDGAGIHAIERLRGKNLPDHVELVDGGTLSFTLLEQVENAEFLIIVDAAELDSEPGTVRLLENAEMDEFLATSRRPSVHEVNLLDVLTAARLRRRMPARYAMVGIQPLDVEWSSNPSEPVDKAVDEAVEIIVRLVGKDS
ncbi:MAG TPA: HyaD/HybD family hydrogenase maturation endopeptidase [Wenzhouxiangellaceae bacterium]|nr:HyaD/HybD family hydrogenase maturation endopeptidase [Wenzhouxiangellaceae bacterium]